MNKFINSYLSIIFEERFSDKKWKFDSIYNDFEIYFNFDHVKSRLKSRYGEEDIFTVILFLFHIIDYVIENKVFEKEKFNKSKKYGLIQGFTFYGSVSDVWICGVLQNDILEKKKRLYCSTLLDPTEHEHRDSDIQIRIDI